MKKIISLILTTCIIISLVSAIGSIGVSAASGDLLFDMDVSGFDKSISGSYGVKGKTGYGEGCKVVFDGFSYQVASKREYINANGDKVEYINFTNNWQGGYNFRVDVPELANKSLTAEFWVRTKISSVAPYLAFLGGNPTSTGLVNSASIQSHQGDFYLDYAKGKTKLSDTEWQQVAFVRERTEKGMDTRLYVNGEQKSYKTYENGWTDEDTATFYLPRHNNGINASSCPDMIDFASLKLYEGALSSVEISSHYDRELPCYTPAELGIKFTDESGEEVTSLDGLTEVDISYTASNEDAVWIIGACYDGSGILLGTYKEEVTAAGELAIDIPPGTEMVKAFVWNKAALTPMTESIVLEYTDGYDPSVVTVDAAFYDDTNSVIKYMAGKTGIYAKANISSLLPPKDMTAELKLVRDGENVFADEADVVFTNRAAEVTIPLTGVTPREGDQLVFTLYDSERTYAIKKLNFADVSKILDIILVAGQSNALGQGGDASQSIRPEAGTVYYNTMNTQLTSNQGWDSALGKTWHDETGHTVLIVKATWGGTGFPTKPNLDTGVSSTSGSDTYGWWNPGNSGSKTGIPYDCYTLAKEKYAAAVASIDTDKYTIGDCVYFWNQGENENNSYTAEQYETAFLELHNKFKTEFGTEDTRLTYGGILPVRSSYSKGFPNLKLTGPRIAQYNMAKKYDELFVVSDATEHWYSDAAINEWFRSEYNGITYPSGTLPSAWGDIMNTDNVHYKQLAMNEMGKEAARSMLAYLKEDNAPTGIDLITPNGIEHYSDGDSITLTEEGAIPVIPVSVGTKASFAVSGDAASIDENGVLKPGEALLNDYAILTVTPDTGSVMTFKVYSPLVDDSINISAVKDNKAAIYSLTTDDNYAYTNKWLDTKLSEHAGMVATMGLITDIMGNDGKLTWQEAQELVAAGRWGVASHTKAHKQSTFASLTEEELDEEINGARDVLARYFPDEKLLAMYTPGGITSELIRSKVKENHHILRHAGGGNNSLPISESGMLALKSQYINSSTTVNTMNGWVDTAITNGQWIVEMWHGVGDTDAASWGGNTTEEIADAHIDYVAQKANEGKLWVTTLDEAAIYMIQRLKTRIHIVSESDNKLVFTLTDELDDTVYDSALTVNIPIPDGYTTANVSYGEKSVDSVVSDGMVSVTLKPDGGNITVIFD